MLCVTNRVLTTNPPPPPTVQDLSAANLRVYHFECDLGKVQRKLQSSPLYLAKSKSVIPCIVCHLGIKKTNISIRKLHDFFTDLHIPCLPASKKLMAVVVPPASKSFRVASPLPAPGPAVTQPVIKHYTEREQAAQINPSFYHETAQAHVVGENFSDDSQVSSNVSVRTLPLPVPVPAGQEEVNRLRRKKASTLPSALTGQGDRNGSYLRHNWCSAHAGHKKNVGGSLQSKPGAETEMFETDEESRSASDGVPDFPQGGEDSDSSDAGVMRVSPKAAMREVVIHLQRVKEPVLSHSQV